MAQLRKCSSEPDIVPNIVEKLRTDLSEPYIVPYIVTKIRSEPGCLNLILSHILWHSSAQPCMNLILSLVLWHSSVPPFLNQILSLVYCQKFALDLTCICADCPASYALVQFYKCVNDPLVQVSNLYLKLCTEYFLCWCSKLPEGLMKEPAHIRG